MKRWIYRIFAIVVAIAAPTSVIVNRVKGNNYNAIYLLWLLFLLIVIVPSIGLNSIREKRLQVIQKGVDALFVYVVASIVNAIVFLCYTFNLGNFIFANKIEQSNYSWIAAAFSIVPAMTVLYWNGIIRIMLKSKQIGGINKVLAVLIGWFFPFSLPKIIHILKEAQKEVKVENDKIILNEQRKNDKVCQTKYPLLMVHGVFFRDFKPAFLNYWGRISNELINNGARIYYGNQQSALSVEESGAELAERIKSIVQETGCEKVNIIAHSKGGLDSRAAIARYGVEDMVASLTTINTPHRGCEFADYLLGKLGQSVKDAVAATYNRTLKMLGDENPNFIEAVTDLTHEACEAFNENTKDSKKVFYQSVGSFMRRSCDGKFPLNLTNRFVQIFDGRNDGLVGEKSFEWGSNYIFLEPKGNRGISHGDVIDLNKDNIEGFDVREFYVQLVNDLRNRGF